MLRQLFVIVCLAGTTTALAQQPKNPPAKPKEKQAAEIDYKETGASMPPIKVLLYEDSAKKSLTKEKVNPKGGKKADNVYLTSEDLDNGANLFVMMFNPTCSHCEDEAAVLRNNIFLFKKTKLVLMANPGMKQYLPDFVNRQHLDEYPSFNIGIDSSDFINKTYLFQMLPQINIYDHDRKLLKIYNGEVAIDSLKKYIE